MLEKFKRGGVGHCLIKLDRVYDDATGVKGIGGQELVLGDPDFRKERRARTWGTIVQVPISMGNHPLYQVRNGFPAYGPVRLPEADIDPPSNSIYSTPKNTYKFMSDISQDLVVGDKVYFSWMATYDKKNLVARTAPDQKGNESFIFRVSYDLIYCAIRGKEVIMIGGNVMVDPIMETMDSIFVPTYYPFKDRTGKPMLRPKNEWIQKKVAPEHIDREGIVAHVGDPIKGEFCYIRPGMKVIYKPSLKSMLDIEGKKYFIVPQNQILCYEPISEIHPVLQEQ
jgi:hypothetical protein